MGWPLTRWVQWTSSKPLGYGQRRAFYIREGTEIFIDGLWRCFVEQQSYISGTIAQMWYSVDFAEDRDIKLFAMDGLLEDHSAVDCVNIDDINQGWILQVMVPTPRALNSSLIDTDWIALDQNRHIYNESS